MPRTTDEQRERREIDILRVAGQMILEHGYTQLNMDELAERVGISKPTLYQHFRTKEDMVAQAVIHATEAMEQFILSLQEGTPLQRLEKIMRYVVNTHFDPKNTPAALMHGHTQEVLQHHVAVHAVRERSAGLLYGLVQEGKIHGEIRADLLPQVVIGGLFSMIGILEFYGRNVPAPQREVMVEQVVDLFLRGVRA